MRLSKRPPSELSKRPPRLRNLPQLPGLLGFLELQGLNISKGSNASTRKEEIDQHGYAVPKDNVVNRPWVGRLGGASRNGSAGGNKSRDFIPKSDTGGNEYAIPQIPPNMDQGSKPKSSKHRERRKQMSMQQGIPIVFLSYNQ